MGHRPRTRTLAGAWADRWTSRSRQRRPSAYRCAAGGRSGDGGEVGRFAKIKLEIGTQLIAEGADGYEVVFTSRFDDRYGAGGTFDTNNDDFRGPSRESAFARQLGGHLRQSPFSSLSLDRALLTFAGGIDEPGRYLRRVQRRRNPSGQRADHQHRAGEQRRRYGRPSRDRNRDGHTFNAPGGDLCSRCPADSSRQHNPEQSGSASGSRRTSRPSTSTSMRSERL
jgi:hypothetical protein